MRPDRAALYKMPRASEPELASVGLLTLALLFLRIGCTGFGGFMAMVSVTQQVLCERRRLLPISDLLDGLALASVLPGPVAVNVAAYAGYRLRGVSGAMIAVVATVLPAFLCMVWLGTLYLHYDHLAALTSIFRAIEPAIIAIVLAAGIRLWRSAIESRRQAFLAMGAALAMACAPGLATTISVMTLSAAIGYHWRVRGASYAPSLAHTTTASGSGLRRSAWLSALLVLPLAWLTALTAAPIVLQLAGVFAGMSLLAFGGGYVFIPLLQHTVVDNHHWLSTREFIDILAITQLSPGPAMISSALIGLKVAGLSGALAATLGMFVPSAIVIIAASGALQWIRRSAAVQAALGGMRAALAGMVFAAAYSIARGSGISLLSVLPCALALVALLRFRLDAVLLVAGYALAGFILS